jgi:FAD:protein FMN transferase
LILRFILVVFFVSKISLGFCQNNGYIKIEGAAQGTSYTIIFEKTNNSGVSKTALDSILLVIDQSMSLWKPKSLINKINQNESYIVIDKHFEKVFKTAVLVSKISNGYFDITVKPLVKAWGFGADGNSKTPTQKQLDSIKTFVGYQKIKLIKGQIQKTDKRVQLDLNAIAQGYTVDVIAEYLAEKGIKNYLVEIGGEVTAKGKNKEGKPWSIGIQKPNFDIELEAVVNLNNMALATSGSYQNTVVRNGKRYSHAINPKTGYPVSHNVLSVSVLAKNCMLADAYATVFLVMGLEKSKILAKKIGLDFFMIFEVNGKSEVFITPGFVRQIKN